MTIFNLACAPIDKFAQIPHSNDWLHKFSWQTYISIFKIEEYLSGFDTFLVQPIILCSIFWMNLLLSNVLHRDSSNLLTIVQNDHCYQTPLNHTHSKGQSNKKQRLCPLSWSGKKKGK